MRFLSLSVPSVSIFFVPNIIHSAFNTPNIEWEKGLFFFFFLTQEREKRMDGYRYRQWYWQDNYCIDGISGTHLLDSQRPSEWREIENNFLGWLHKFVGYFANPSNSILWHKIMRTTKWNWETLSRQNFLSFRTRFHRVLDKTLECCCAVVKIYWLLCIGPGEFLKIYLPPSCRPWVNLYEKKAFETSSSLVYFQFRENHSWCSWNQIYSTVR